MASLEQLYQELNRLRGRKRANPRAILAAAGESAQRQKEEDYWRRRQEEKMFRLAEKEQSALRIKELQEQDLARRQRDIKTEKERKAKERHDDYQAAIYGIDAGVPELANRFMQKYGPEDVNPTFTYDQKTKQFKLTHPGRELGPTDMERVGGIYQIKEGPTLKAEQAKSLLEKFQSIESFRESQKRKSAATKERRAEVKTGIEVGQYKLEVDKFKREGQQGLSDKDRFKMFGYFQRDRAAGMIDPDVTFDDYLSEAGIGGASTITGPQVGIPEQQQAGGVRY